MFPKKEKQLYVYLTNYVPETVAIQINKCYEL